VQCSRSAAQRSLSTAAVHRAGETQASKQTPPPARTHHVLRIDGRTESSELDDRGGVAVGRSEQERSPVFLNAHRNTMNESQLNFPINEDKTPPAHPSYSHRRLLQRSRTLSLAHELGGRGGVAMASGAHERGVAILLRKPTSAGAVAVSAHGGAVYDGRACLVHRVGVRAQTHELSDRARVAAFRCVQKRSAAALLMTQSSRTSGSELGWRAAVRGAAGGRTAERGTGARAGTRAATNPHVRPGRDEAANFCGVARSRRFHQLRHRTR
jgi:hypothetical protein